jgi:hypothetical protein
VTATVAPDPGDSTRSPSTRADGGGDLTVGMHVAPCGDTALAQPCPHIPLRRRPVPGRRELRTLDNALFTAPFLLLDAANNRVGHATTPAHAHAMMEQRCQAVAIVGTLIDGVWAVDIDPADADADPILGDVATELLIAWAEQWHLHWLLRESGRPGGRHVIVRVPQMQLDQLRARACEIATQLGVPMTVRKALRLLRSPHRLGLPAPLIGGTLTTEHLNLPPTCTLRSHRPTRPIPTPHPPPQTPRLSAHTQPDTPTPAPAPSSTAGRSTAHAPVKASPDRVAPGASDLQ